MGGLKAECTQVARQDCSLLSSLSLSPGFSTLTFVCLAYSAVGSLEGASVGFTCLLEMGSHSVTGTRCVDQAHLELTEIYLPVPPRTGINPAVL